MPQRLPREGFTLVEVMIVVVIMAILAATIIPQFSGSADDARQSAGAFNQRTMQMQIHLYQVNHRGNLPTDLTKLTTQTNIDGGPGTDYGPYLNAILENPFN